MFYSNIYNGFNIAVIFFLVIFSPHYIRIVGINFLFIDLFIIFLLIIRFQILSKHFFTISAHNNIYIYIFLILLCTFISQLYNIAFGNINFSINDFSVYIRLLRFSLIYFITSSFYLDEKNLNKFSFYFIVISLIMITIGFIQFMFPNLLLGFTNTFYVTPEDRLLAGTSGFNYRAVGSFGNPNQFAFGLVFFFLINLNMAIHRINKFPSLHYLMSILLFFSIVMLTSSRTGVVGAILLFLYNIKNIRFSRNIIYAFLIICIGYLISIFLVENNLIHNRIYNFILVDNIYDLFNFGFESRREMYWIDSIDRILRQPILGYGYSTLQYQIVDNGYLSTLLRNGVVGFIFYILFFVKLVSLNFSNSKDSNIMFGQPS